MNEKDLIYSNVTLNFCAPRRQQLKLRRKSQESKKMTPDKFNSWGWNIFLFTHQQHWSLCAKTQIGFVLLNCEDKSVTWRKPRLLQRVVTSVTTKRKLSFNSYLDWFSIMSQAKTINQNEFLCMWNPLAYSFLQLSLNSHQHGKPNIYTSALACLTLKACSRRTANEWKSFRHNTSSSWWVPGHFAQVWTSFSGHGRPGGTGGLRWGALGEKPCWRCCLCEKRQSVRLELAPAQRD